LTACVVTTARPLFPPGSAHRDGRRPARRKGGFYGV